MFHKSGVTGVPEGQRLQLETSGCTVHCVARWTAAYYVSTRPTLSFVSCFSCLATYDAVSSSWATVAKDSSYASYSVLSVAPDNKLVAIGNIHGALKILLVKSLSPLCKLLKLFVLN